MSAAAVSTSISASTLNPNSHNTGHHFPSSTQPPEPTAASSSNSNPAATQSTSPPPPPAPQLHVNGKPASAQTPAQESKSSSASSTSETDASGWGANFWVTLADPSVRAALTSCQLNADFTLSGFAFLIDRCLLLCLSSHRPGQLGPSCRELSVSPAYLTFLVVVMRRTQPSAKVYLPAPTANGGK